MTVAEADVEAAFASVTVRETVALPFAAYAVT